MGISIHKEYPVHRTITLVSEKQPQELQMQVSPKQLGVEQNK